VKRYLHLARLAIVVASLFAGNLSAANSNILRMATTTSTDNSGLLKVLQPALEDALNIRLHVIAVGTGKALEMGRRGDVDLVFVHAREAENQFVKDGYGLERHEVMYNDFVIVGPADDPAGVSGLTDASQAVAKIAGSTQSFISRGDDSGTHKKENVIWSQAGIEPQGEWYRQVGQGMGKTLQIAGELGAYTLVDRGTWLAYRHNIDLQLLVSGGTELKNTYGLIAVNPQRFPDVNIEAAQGLINWFQSEACRRLITDFRVDGEQLFHVIGH